jgi:dTDP-4-dehydrorhamnose 3,5-epimerase
METYNDQDFLPVNIGPFVQDNQSFSHKNVLRGLHFQSEHPQGKLVRVINGIILDVAVDIRKNSPTYKQWFSIELSDVNNQMLWIPPGLAHGFLTLSDCATVLYKVTDFRYPEFEKTIMWNDPDLHIDWTIKNNLILSEKDSKAKMLKDIEI